MRLIDLMPAFVEGQDYSSLAYYPLDEILKGRIEGLAHPKYGYRVVLSEAKLREACDAVCERTGHITLDEIIAHANVSYTEAMEDLISLMVLVINEAESGSEAAKVQRLDDAQHLTKESL